jgi:hypothetical protein
MTTTALVADQLQRTCCISNGTDLVVRRWCVLKDALFVFPLSERVP